MVVGAAGAGTREVASGRGARRIESAMLYRAWVEERRAIGREDQRRPARLRAHGRHGRRRDRQLNLDLDSEKHEKDGIVFDMRNNNGGFVNGYALDILSRART